MSDDNALDPEVEAINRILGALKGLDAAAQSRAIRYVSLKLGLDIEPTQNRSSKRDDGSSTEAEPGRAPESEVRDLDETLQGVSPVAQKWVRRSGLKAQDLSKIFSLGGDEIDLVARSIPGKATRERMHNVALLKGIAAYLATGAARVPFEDLKEACLHYDAYNRAHFAEYLKEFAPEMGGSKESGFTLNARGMTAATDLVKTLTRNEE